MESHVCCAPIIRVDTSECGFAIRENDTIYHKVITQNWRSFVMPRIYAAMSAYARSTFISICFVYVFTFDPGKRNNFELFVKLVQVCVFGITTIGTSGWHFYAKRYLYSIAFFFAGL
jgi:hypothetical protein